MTTATCPASAGGDGECSPLWTHFPGGDLDDGSFWQMVVFDEDHDGPNPPALFAGGQCFSAGGVQINHIGRWDGVSWSDLNGGMDNQVYCFQVFDEDGSGPNPPVLIAGGSFTHAGGRSANRIARWNGETWSGIGSGMDDPVTSLAVFDADGPGGEPPALYASGVFELAGGVAANHIARWDGTTWHPVGAGLNAGAVAMTVHDTDGEGPEPPALYVGGTFTEAGGKPAGSIARWDGTNWATVGSGLVGESYPTVADFATFEEGGGSGPAVLYVGGTFDSAGDGTLLNNIARWDGSGWSSVGGGMIAPVVALSVHDDDGPGANPPRLYAGGRFEEAGGVVVNQVAVWDGVEWAPLGQGLPPTDGVTDLVPFDEDGAGDQPADLYICGSFDALDGLFAFRIGKWTGTQWLPLGSGVNGYGPSAMALFDHDAGGPEPPALYLGGTFDVVDGVVAHRVARYDGSGWEPLGDGLDGSVEALVVWDEDGVGGDDPVLVAGGGFNSSGENKDIRKVAMWDGERWSPLGSGMTSDFATPEVLSLAAWDPDGPAGPEPASLFAGGIFEHADGHLVHNIARWTGSTWEDLDGGLRRAGHNSAWVHALAVFDPDGDGPEPSALYAGGQFNLAGGQSASGIAKWDGTSWSPLGVGVFAPAGEPQVRAMMEWDLTPGSGQRALYVGGRFSQAGGSPARFIARWDGETWSSVGQGMDHWVMALVPADLHGDAESSEALYACGSFTSAGSSAANYIARWDGESWLALDDIGLSGNGLCLGTFDADADGAEPLALYIGGAFSAAGGFSSSQFAKWSLLSISRQPQDKLVGEGQTVSFSVSATGSGELGYQWRRNGKDLADGGSVSGATTDCLTIAPVAEEHGGNYDVVIIDDCATVWSRSASLDVTPVGDVDGDGVVSFNDLLMVLAAWGDCPEPPEVCPEDLDSDHLVGISDLLTVLSEWG